MGEITKKLECDLLMRGGITSGIVWPILTTAAGLEWLGLGAIFLSALIFILAFGLLGTVVGVGVDLVKRLPANGYGPLHGQRTV